LQHKRQNIFASSLAIIHIFYDLSANRQGNLPVTFEKKYRCDDDRYDDDVHERDESNLVHR